MAGHATTATAANHKHPMRRTGATPKSAEGELDLEICLEFDGAEFNEAAKHRQANAGGVSQRL